MTRFAVFSWEIAGFGLCREDGFVLDWLDAGLEVVLMNLAFNVLAFLMHFGWKNLLVNDRWVHQLLNLGLLGFDGGVPNMEIAMGGIGRNGGGASRWWYILVLTVTGSEIFGVVSDERIGMLTGATSVGAVDTGVAGCAGTDSGGVGV